MRALNKVVATGAFGGLAAATIAGSVAFACTPQTALRVTDASGTPRGATDTVRPGEVLTVGASTFAEGGIIEITWHDPILVGAPGQLIARGAGPNFSAPLTVPADARRTNTGFQLVATQYDALRTTMVKTAMTQVFVSPDAPRVGEVPASDTAPAGPVETTPAPTASIETPAAAPPATPTASAPAASRPATAAPRATASAPAAVSAPAASAATATPIPAQPAATPDAPSAAQLPVRVTAGQPQVAADDLWSGLSADRTPSLLDTAAPAAPSRSVPTGGILLLGVGVLALGAAALEAARRRLVVSRITRR